MRSRGGNGCVCVYDGFDWFAVGHETAKKFSSRRFVTIIQGNDKLDDNNGSDESIDWVVGCLKITPLVVGGWKAYDHQDFAERKNLIRRCVHCTMGHSLLWRGYKRVPVRTIRVVANDVVSRQTTSGI